MILRVHVVSHGAKICRPIHTLRYRYAFGHLISDVLEVVYWLSQVDFVVQCSKGSVIKRGGDGEGGGLRRCLRGRSNGSYDLNDVRLPAIRHYSSGSQDSWLRCSVSLSTDTTAQAQTEWTRYHLGIISDWFIRAISAFMGKNQRHRSWRERRITSVWCVVDVSDKSKLIRVKFIFMFLIFNRNHHNFVK